MTRSLPWGVHPDRLVKNKRVPILRRRRLENDNVIMVIPQLLLLLGVKLKEEVGLKQLGVCANY